MGLRDLNADIRAGISYANDEHTSFLQLGRVAVIVGMQLHDVGTKFLGKCRPLGVLIICHGYHYLVGFEMLCTCLYDKVSVFVGKAFYFDSGLNRKTEVFCIVLEIVCHLLLGGKCIASRGER